MTPDQKTTELKFQIHTQSLQIEDALRRFRDGYNLGNEHVQQNVAYLKGQAKRLVESSLRIAVLLNRFVQHLERDEQTRRLLG